MNSWVHTFVKLFVMMDDLSWRFSFPKSSFQPNEMVFTICNSISRTYFRLMREIGKVQQMIRKFPRNGKDWSRNCELIFEIPLFHFTFNRNFQICWLNCKHSYCLWGNLRDSSDCLFIQHKLETLKIFKYLAFIVVSKSSNQMVSISAWLQTLKNLNCKLHMCLSVVSLCSEPFNLKRSSFPL